MNPSNLNLPYLQKICDHKTMYVKRGPNTTAAMCLCALVRKRFEEAGQDNG